jgi:hypothetical protein
MDEIADLADRLRAMTEFEFAIEWGRSPGTSATS